MQGTHARHTCKAHMQGALVSTWQLLGDATAKAVMMSIKRGIITDAEAKKLQVQSIIHV